MNLIRLAVKTMAIRAWAFENATNDPMRYQKKVLFEYLKRNRNTEYGLKYKFASINSIEEYQERVPVVDSEEMRPYMERMAAGELKVLTADKPIFFGTTSGTTNKQKFIPVTKYSQAKKDALAGLWAYYITRDHPKVLDGRILAIISTEVDGYTPSGAPYGGESGHGYKNLPEAIKLLYSLPYEVFDITDYDARYYSILRISMADDISTIATLNPSSIILLCHKIDKWKNKIIDDIERGTLSKDFKIPRKTRRAIKRRLRPDRKRARELRTILKEKGKLLPKDFWPNMEIIECWKGGTVKFYLKELPRFFGDVKIRDFGCLSTEARSSIPMSDVGAGGVLAVKTNFYEFMPKEDMGSRRKRYLLADQLEKGKQYFLIVTTPGGLYRYNIDDVIMVDGYFNKTPMIEFVQKGLNAISVTGEKLYESQVNEAMNRALDKNKLLVEFFSTTIEWDDPSRYVFYVEFNTAPSMEQELVFLDSLEEELCKENTEYKEKREMQLLAAPVLKVVKKGDFEKYCAKRIEEGAHDGQIKIPELTLDHGLYRNFHVEREVRAR